MKEYKKVLEFKYKNQKYNMYLDENNKKYFLKVDENGNLNYLTDKEFAELTIFFTSVPKIMRIRKTKEEKTKLFPKVIVGGVTVTLTLSVLLGGLNQIGVKISDFFPSTSTSEVIENEGDLENYISLELNKEKEVDTYQYKNGTNLEIYDMESLDMVMENEEITLNSLIEVINDNNSIPTYYKKLLIEYCESLTNKYPDIDLRVFYTNLKTLKINECTESEMHTKAGGEDTYGCYMKKTNEIYVIEEMDYKYNPWAHQVLFHELSHCLRIGNYEINGTKVKVQPEGPSFNNEITTEALNSIFAVSLFDYEENDIAYQLQSNYHKIMIECLDNYKLSD